MIGPGHPELSDGEGRPGREESHEHHGEHQPTQGEPGGLQGHKLPIVAEPSQGPEDREQDAHRQPVDQEFRQPIGEHAKEREQGDIAVEHEIRELGDEIENDKEHKAGDSEHEGEDHLPNEIAIYQPQHSFSLANAS
ncbi:hypothetical protein HRbin07_00649 [bacterium HR07]|nr:hypothetical protein HRbin07_00649 [bacterium HR07]